MLVALLSKSAVVQYTSAPSAMAGAIRIFAELLMAGVPPLGPVARTVKVSDAPTRWPTERPPASSSSPFAITAHSDSSSA